MGRTWEGPDRDMAADRQCRTADEQADHAERYIPGLTPREAPTKAGALSGNFRLKDLCKNFC
jgi:hypothetical protein